MKQHIFPCQNEEKIDSLYLLGSEKRKMVKNKKIEDTVEKICSDITGILKACLEYQEDGYDKGYVNGLRDGRAQESESFTILEACKGNMKEEFEASPKMLLEIDQFTDDQMERIAEDVGSQLEEHFWNALRLAVEAELEGRR